jgi:hypothetical protein
MSRHQKVGQYHNLLIANKSLKSVTEIKYWGIATYQNFIDEEIKSRLNSGIAFCYLVQRQLSCLLLPKHLKTIIHNTIILRIVLHGCDIRLLYYGKNIDWRCLITWCWGDYLKLWGRKWQEAREHFIRKTFTIFTLHQIRVSLGWINLWGWDGGMYHAWKRWYMHKVFWLTIWKEETTYKITLKMILEK